MDEEQLDQIVAELIRRKRAARKGSAAHAFIVRQLQGLARDYEHGAGIVTYYDPYSAEYDVYG